MRLFRPYIPLKVRILVIQRQLSRANPYPFPTLARIPGESVRAQLSRLLYALFGDRPVHLDHDPALENRKRHYSGPGKTLYDPPANDPDHLFYREVASHQIKTNVRGDNGRRSDREERAHQKALDRNRGRLPKRKSQKIASRPTFGRVGRDHEWFIPKFLNYQCCKNCGVVRRADDRNNPCKGRVAYVGPRRLGR